MKKFLTLIALTSALIPALHGMDTQLPTDVQQKYDNLTALIKNADADGFKPAFDAITLPPEYIAALRNNVAETKKTITVELDALADKTKNWSKIAKGSLATFLSGWAGLAIPAVIHMYPNPENETPIALVAGLPAYGFAFLGNVSLEKTCETNDIHPIGTIFLTTNILACLRAAYKGIPYGIKTLKAGWNYKEHLQNMLANIDAIDAHITQAEA